MLKRNVWPELSLAEIVKRSRILVVDDQDFPYKELFERDGYQIEKRNDVERMADLEQGAFDLVLLDLHGVGQTQSTEEGLGLLKHVRTANPAQLVIAYSNADWSLRFQPFFELADAVLP